MADVARSIVVRVGDVETRLAGGEEFWFGRDAGQGQVTADDLAVSGRHGCILATAAGWSVRSTGSVHSFAVYDCDTPSRLFVPRGAGPIEVPFAAAMVVIDVEYRHYAIGVTSAGATGWAGNWTSLRVGPPGGEQGTVAAWNAAPYADRNGRVLRWYQVLVAMCEPRLRLPADRREERIPTNREIAARLGISIHVLENHHIDRLRRELGFSTYTEQVRQAAVLIAINQGLVTTADLDLLDRPSSDPDSDSGDHG
jgi:hypothetical protein